MSEENTVLLVPTEEVPTVPEQELAAPTPPTFEETPVLPIDDIRTVQTDSDAARDDLLDLMESKQSNRLLTGILSGIEHPGGSNMPVAVIYHGDYKVIIPVEEAILPPEDYHGFPQNQVHAYLLTHRMSAEVDYVVKGVDQDAKIAVASRLDAMRIKRRRYYYARDRNGDDLIRPGIRAEARVMTAIRNGIFVELFGLETFIPMEELSYQRMNDARGEFRPGQRVLVRVLELEKADRANIKAVLSVKQAKEDPARKAFGRFQIDNLYAGTVTIIRPNGIYVALDGGIDCLCKLTTRDRPSRGTRVTVRVLGKDAQRSRLWGVIVYMV